MKGLRIIGKPPPALANSPQPDKRELLKTGVLSLFLHMVFIVSLVLYLKTGIIKGDPACYRVTVMPFSPQNISVSCPPQGLPAPQPVPAKTQIQEEEKIDEKIEQKPFEEPKQPRQDQEDEKTITKPIPLPMASISPSDVDSSLENDQDPAIPSPVSLQGNDEIAAEGSIAREGLGVGIGGSGAGGPGEGLGTGQDGSRWGGPGEGKGRGNSPWAGSGKASGTGRGVPGKGGSGVGSPRYGQNPKPVYPLEARQKGHQGKVVLTVKILPNGRVGEVQVDKSSGYETLDHAAVEAVKKWKFIPAKKEGVAILCWVSIPFRFQLLHSKD